MPKGGGDILPKGQQTFFCWVDKASLLPYVLKTLASQPTIQVKGQLENADEPYDDIDDNYNGNNDNADNDNDDSNSNSNINDNNNVDDDNNGNSNINNKSLQQWS